MLRGGNVIDCTRFAHVMAAIGVERPGPVGLASGQTTSSPTRATAPRPSEPTCVDAAAGTPSPNAPTSRPTAAGEAAAAAGPPTLDKQLYKRRNVVERCLNRLKQCRSVATRYDKTATSYQATVTIAALLQWW
ncbi:transposase [Micromonospora chersina]|uniref:transposase n=1 Tax=Micromonospora chersina TaxID=47854 RepID=UPI0033DB8843